MILKEVKIQNFRSYYGADNEITLSPGLTLILGDNGDGKTTFFEALEWLFNTAIDDKSELNISEKRKSELAVGDDDQLMVALKFDHDGEKELIKSFKFEKRPDGSIYTSDFRFVGIENVGSERVSLDGKRLLERCFDAIVRKYCLFKGETELNIFNGETALQSLVDTFSDVRKFQEYVDMTTKFEEDAARVVEKEMKSDEKAAKQARALLVDLTQAKKERDYLISEIKTQDKAIEDYSTRLEVLERNQDACEQYQDIKNRIAKKKDEINRLNAYIELDYNTCLLDDSWILRPYLPILHEFQAKIAAFSKEKRKLETQDVEAKAKAKGAHEAIEQIQKLANGVAPLPWNLPDKDTMQEMIDEEVCKVCGRPAPKGTPAYDFMVEKLNQYLRKVEEEAHKRMAEAEEKPLFPNDYIDELRTRSIQMGGDTEKWIAQIATEIADRLEFIQTRKQELQKLKGELQEAEDEKARLLLQSQGLTEEMLEVSFSDFKGFSDRKARAEVEKARLEKDLEQQKILIGDLEDQYSKIETDNTSIKIYQRVHTALKKIMEAFVNAKERNINDFLSMLEEKANDYMETLNKNDFRGLVKIVRKIDGKAEIRLYSSNDTIIANPNQALKTTMYMSVLFAISNITTLKREEDYPLIFDAPTSSFGDLKEDDFYNIIDKIDKQCIIVTKDLLVKQGDVSILNEEKINELTCSVYRIKKKEGFDALDLSTIQTTISKVK